MNELCACLAGAIRDKWARFGWEQGILGYPMEDERSIPGIPFPHGPAGSEVILGGGIGQRFEHSFIFQENYTIEAFEVHGDIGLLGAIAVEYHSVVGEPGEAAAMPADLPLTRAPIPFEWYTPPAFCNWKRSPTEFARYLAEL